MITGHFVDADLPTIDGVVRIARAYREAMERELGPSWLVAPHHPGAHDRDPRKIEFFSVPFRKPYRWGLPALDLTLRRRLAAVPFDVLHSHTPFVAGKLALDCGRRLRRPVLFTFHSRYPDWCIAQYKRSPRWLAILALDAALRRPRVHRIALRHLRDTTEEGLRFCVQTMQRAVWSYCSQVDCVLLPTATLRDEVLAYRDACHPTERSRPPPRIELVRQGIDFPRHAGGRVRVRDRHGVPRHVPLFLFVGQLAHEKEITFLLDALAVVARRGQDFRLLLVGEGPFRADFEQQAQRLGIAARCRFVGVIADQEILADYYAQSDLFLFPSLYETQGLAAMEAASFGVPLVGQAGAPGLSEVFTDGVTAALPPRDPESYAAAVCALVRDPEQRRALGENARRVVVRADQTVKRVMNLYRELLAAPRTLEARRGAVK